MQLGDPLMVELLLQSGAQTDAVGGVGTGPGLVPALRCVAVGGRVEGKRKLGVAHNLR